MTLQADVTRWQRIKAVLQRAIDCEPADRMQLLDAACPGDPDLRREVARLLAAHEAAGAFLESTPGPEFAAALLEDEAGAWIGSRIGAYRIERLLGQGGMGTVYLAERVDDQFRKSVAVKVIKRGMDTDAVLRRFQHERQILADLDHPNIARLLDAGATADGVPYFVMEYVDGLRIDRFCDAQGLTLDARLRLFQRVCGAVQYAHSRLVVHRDLKPGNILITRDEEPKLLDFGIARLLATDARDDTDTAGSVMTPESAAPEQLRGGAVTTATDVYALGVLLYKLLTGCSPYQLDAGADHRAITDAVLNTQPSPPSSAAPRALRRQLQGDLDTIVLTALRKEPERRYPSVEQLAEDLRRHVAGLPVRARGERITYRAGKFVSRHRLGVGASAVAALILVAAMVTSIWQMSIAREERARAERRFADVRSLAGALLSEIHDAVEKLPGSTPARAIIVNRALAYLDSLSREATDDAGLQRELAEAYERVGNVQGGFGFANLGDLNGAIDSYTKEIALREALRARGGADVDVVLDLANGYRRLGILQRQTGAAKAGLETVLKAAQLVEPLQTNHANDPAVLQSLGRIHNAIGANYRQLGSAAESTAHQQRALERWEAALRIEPRSVDALRGIVVSRRELGFDRAEAGAMAEAVDHYRQAVIAAEERVALAPEDVIVRRELGVAYHSLAINLRRAGELDEAAIVGGKSLAIDEELLARDPGNSNAQRDVLSALNALATLETERGNLETALTHRRRIVAMAEKRAAATPSDTQARRDLGEVLHFLGALLEKLGRAADALATYERAESVFEDLIRAAADDPRTRALLATLYVDRADLLRNNAGGAAADQHAACERYAKSAAIWNELTALGQLRGTDAAQPDRARRGLRTCAVR